MGSELFESNQPETRFFGWRCLPISKHANSWSSRRAVVVSEHKAFICPRRVEGYGNGKLYAQSTRGRGSLLLGAIIARDPFRG